MLIMVIWKKNPNYVPTAKIDDSLRMKVLEAERMDTAIASAKDFDRDFDSISLVRVIGDKYLYVYDLNDGYIHDGVLVALDGVYLLTKVYSFTNSDKRYFYTNDEIEKWRLDFLDELFKIVKEDAGRAGFTREWALNEVTSLSKRGTAEAMTFNSPKDYADMVTM